MATVPNRAIFHAQTGWTDPVTAEHFPYGAAAIITVQAQLDRIEAAMVAWLDPALDPANVSITGGVIDGTEIGGTAPAAGSFTTLTASAIGVGGVTNPARPLEVDGAIRISDAAPLEWGGVATYITGTAGTFICVTGGFERFRANATGIGVHMTNPGVALDVDGSIRSYSSGSTANIYARTQSGTGHVRFYAVDDGRAFFLNEANGESTGFRYRATDGTPVTAFAFDESATTFYDDVGAAGMVWRPDTRRLGLLLTNPAAPLDVGGAGRFSGNASQYIGFDPTPATSAYLCETSLTNIGVQINCNSTGRPFIWQLADVEKFRVSNTTGDTGGSGSAGSGNQYVEATFGGQRYKLLHDGTL